MSTLLPLVTRFFLIASLVTNSLAAAALSRRTPEQAEQTTSAFLNQTLMPVMASRFSYRLRSSARWEMPALLNGRPAVGHIGKQFQVVGFKNFLGNTTAEVQSTTDASERHEIALQRFSVHTFRESIERLGQASFRQDTPKNRFWNTLRHAVLEISTTTKTYVITERRGDFFGFAWIGLDGLPRVGVSDSLKADRLPWIHEFGELIMLSGDLTLNVINGEISFDFSRRKSSGVVPISASTLSLLAGEGWWDPALKTIKPTTPENRRHYSLRVMLLEILGIYDVRYTLELQTLQGASKMLLPEVQRERIKKESLLMKRFEKAYRHLAYTIVVPFNDPRLNETLAKASFWAAEKQNSAEHLDRALEILARKLGLGGRWFPQELRIPFITTAYSVASKKADIFLERVISLFIDGMALAPNDMSTEVLIDLLPAITLVATSQAERSLARTFDHYKTKLGDDPKQFTSTTRRALINAISQVAVAQADVAFGILLTILAEKRSQHPLKLNQVLTLSSRMARVHPSWSRAQSSKSLSRLDPTTITAFIKRYRVLDRTESSGKSNKTKQSA